jgi:signal transduction histidine kinase
MNKNIVQIVNFLLYGKGSTLEKSNTSRFQKLNLITILYWCIVALPLPFFSGIEQDSMFFVYYLIHFSWISFSLIALRKGKETLLKYSFSCTFILSLTTLALILGQFGRADWLVLMSTPVSLAIFRRPNLILNAFVSFAFYLGLQFHYKFFTANYPAKHSDFYDGYIIGIMFLFMTILFAYYTKSNRLSRKKYMLKSQELENLNESLRHSQGALIKVNQELQQFASCASHDMREPLRTISSFSSLIKARIDKNDKNQELLVFVEDAAKRMATLLDDLISYTRVLPEDQQLDTVDLNQVLSNVKKNLYTKIQETETTIESMQLPEIEANQSQMIMLFQNIISNSIKYRSVSRTPHIKIRWVKKDDGIVLVFTDNGIGMEEKYLNLIFEPFKRLHAIGKYEGSGIGLATCRKIVEYYRGQISATSVYGESTTILADLVVQYKASEFVETQADKFVFQSSAN